MDLRLLYALLLTILPVTELRVGMPLAIIFALEKNIPVLLVFDLIILLNVLVVFFIFYFLDNFHHLLLNIGIYKKSFDYYLRKVQKRVDKFEEKYDKLGFIALMLFVAVPLPGTGAWSGCLVSWILGLDRKKSVLSIASGVIIAGVLILLGSLGVINVFSS